MQQMLLDYWQAFVGLVAGIGVWIAWRQFRQKAPDTANEVTRGSRNRQSGGNGTTVNRVTDGDDNAQNG